MTDDRPAAPAFDPRVAIPFLLVTLIWGSTWLVIRDQLGVVPASWSVAYRFAVGCAAMFAWAAATRQPLRLGRRGQGFVLIVGLMQFVLNFNFVYRSEHYVTSGLVALMFALVFVPNSLLAAFFFQHSVSRRLLAGSAIALGGLGLLFAHELSVSPAGPRAVATGIGLALLGLLAASISNVMQASAPAKAMPPISLLAWAMLWGTLIDAALAWATAGPPVVEMRAGYWLGILYLGLVGSAIAFSLYFGLIRVIGPGRAAYSNVLVPILAMGLSTLFEDYRWSLQAGVGLVLTLAGLVVVLRARSPAR